VQQLRSIPLHYLEEHLGRHVAAKFHAQARGIGSAEIAPGRQRKSISKETTFDTDVDDPTVLRDKLRELAAEVAATARREGLSGSVVTMKIRFSGFETHTRQHRLGAPTHDQRVLLREAWSLFMTSGLAAQPVRLIGIGISGWSPIGPRQADLFDPGVNSEKNQRLLQMLDDATQRFGAGALQLGQSRKVPKRKRR
jgi:DNA polymerase-4